MTITWKTTFTKGGESQKSRTRIAGHTVVYWVVDAGHEAGVDIDGQPHYDADVETLASIMAATNLERLHAIMNDTDYNNLQDELADGLLPVLIDTINIGYPRGYPRHLPRQPPLNNPPG